MPINPWINEFHYDNSGIDTGEFIEIAGAAGIDLTDWSLVLYNGNDGQPYDTLILSGTISDQANGYGTLSFGYSGGSTGIQNGSPDGIALVDPFGNVAEFISYEGAFAAMGGPALGLVSTDIGVSEDGTAAAGGSIGLTGTGNEPGDFTWTVLPDDSPGSPNEMFVPVATADFVNLQFPSSTTTITGQATETIYGRIYEAGVTEAAGASMNIIAQVGYGPAGSDPTISSQWVWTDATFNTQVGNDDEYAGTLTVPAAGNYSYTFRFAIQDGTNPLIYTYADTDGAGTNSGLSFDPTLLGSLTVNWEVINGTSGPDDLSGDGNDEIINGLGGDDHLHGNGGDDQLYGGDGVDLVDGGDGDDLLEGGTGNDGILGGANLFGDTVTYEHASGAVQVNLAAGTATGADGTDQIVDVENVIGSAFDDILVGSDDPMGSSTINGRAGNDLLEGGSGSDYIFGEDGIDTVTYAHAHGEVTLSLGDGTLTTTVSDGNDTLFGIENAIGSDFDDGLFGSEANNVLNGGLGADHMEGYQGDDQYWVDNAGDTVEEGIGAGTDEVRSLITYALTANVENLTLIGSANVNATGNGLANVLTGNSGNNQLNGGAGNDTMAGGAGDDTYIVKDAGDIVIEGSGAGTDTVRSTITYALTANVETLVLAGTDNINGTGNGLANTLWGNAGNNVLNGGGGADMMRGGTGNDVYIVDVAGDRVIETVAAGGGTDTVKAGVSFLIGKNIEALTLTGSAGIDGTGNAIANTITGNAADNSLSGLDGNDTLSGLDGVDRLYGGTGDDILNGGAGNDFLEGGAGQDRVTGGSGADFFVFRDGDFPGPTFNPDRITDFSHSEGDRIRLNYMDANSANGSATNETFSFIGTAAFTHTAGQLRYEQISGNTFVSGDTNGDGFADFTIQVDGSHAFVAGDFVL